MTYREHIADRTLAPAARAAFETILDRQVTLAVDALAAVELGAPACAACIYHSQVEDEADFSLPTIALVLEPERRRLLAEMSPYEVFVRLFNPEAELGPWVDAVPDPMLEPGAVLLEALESAGVIDPQRWLLCRVAKALTLAGVPASRTADFVVAVCDEDQGHALTENLRFAAPPEVAASWERLGLFPRRGPDELEGAGEEDLDEVTAVLEEDVDDDMTVFTARFSGICHVPGAEDGVWGVPLDTALEWAREHTDRVRLVVGDEEFSAGARPLPGLPQWPDGRTVCERPLS